MTLVDDSLLWDDTVKVNFVSVCKFLEVYGKAGLVINGDKFQFCQHIVDFAGMDLTSKGVRPSRIFLDTIAELSSPTNTKEVRAFHGLVNKVNYAFYKSDQMWPFTHSHIDIAIGCMYCLWYSSMSQMCSNIINMF